MQSEEKCFIQMIKEMVQVLASVILRKKYVAVELEQENKFSVSGRALGDFREMIDRGEMNEAENILLEEIHYENKEEVLAAALFYQYIGEKEEKFLLEHQYSNYTPLSFLYNYFKKPAFCKICIPFLLWAYTVDTLSICPQI